MGRTKSCCGVYEWCREILQNDLIAQKTFFSRTEGFVWNFFIVSIHFVFWHNCLQCNAHHRRIMNTGKSGILMALNVCFFRYHFVFIWCFGGGRPLQQFVCRGAMLMFMMPVDVTQCTRFWEGACWVSVTQHVHHKILFRADTIGTTSLVGSLNIFPGSICAKFWGPMKINPRFIF